MGTVRVCGKTCHAAKRAKCRCWCGGLFHGAAGKEARDAFAREFAVDELPTTEQQFRDQTEQGDLFAEVGAGDRWRAAVAAAVAARERGTRESAHV